MSSFRARQIISLVFFLFILTPLSASADSSGECKFAFSYSGDVLKQRQYEDICVDKFIKNGGRSDYPIAANFLEQRSSDFYLMIANINIESSYREKLKEYAVITNKRIELFEAANIYGVDQSFVDYVEFLISPSVCQNVSILQQIGIYRDDRLCNKNYARRILRLSPSQLSADVLRLYFMLDFQGASLMYDSDIDKRYDFLRGGVLCVKSAWRQKNDRSFDFCLRSVINIYRSLQATFAFTNNASGVRESEVIIYLWSRFYLSKFIVKQSYPEIYLGKIEVDFMKSALNQYLEGAIDLVGGIDRIDFFIRELEGELYDDRGIPVSLKLNVLGRK